MKIRTFDMVLFALLIALMLSALAVGEASAGTPGCTTQSGEFAPNGYIDRTWCTPGMITNESWYTPAPEHIVGKAVWYAPWVMEATAEWREMSLDGFVGGVSLFSPSDIGEIVWLKRPDKAWEGPYLVVDASQRNHMYTTLTFVQEVVEVDFETALRWGMVTGEDVEYEVAEWMIREVEVWKGLEPPDAHKTPVRYSDWFAERVIFDEREIANVLWKFDSPVYKNITDYEIGLAQLDSTPKVAKLAQSWAKTPLVEVYGTYEEWETAWNLRSWYPPLQPAQDLLHVIEPIIEPISIQDAHNYTQAYRASMQLTEITWEVDCEDGNPYTGFMMLGDCIPGVISYDKYWEEYPKYTTGVATYYADGVMEQVLHNRGMSLNGYKDAIVLMSCAHVGDSVWLRRPGNGWEGPYLVVDCSQPWHMYLNLTNRNLHIEVDQSRWLEWQRTSGTQNIELCIGSSSCEGVVAQMWYEWGKGMEFMIP